MAATDSPARPAFWVALLAVLLALTPSMYLGVRALVDPSSMDPLAVFLSIWILACNLLAAAAVPFLNPAWRIPIVWNKAAKH